MRMHTGTTEKKGKSVVMYVPRPFEIAGSKKTEANQPWSYERADTSSFEIGTNGTIHFEKELNYLGSILSYDLNDLTAIMARIDKAKGALMANKAILSDRKTPPHVKRRLYQSIVLSSLLWGIEGWTISEEAATQLKQFQTFAMSILAGFSKYEFQLRGTSSEKIRKGLKIEDIMNCMGVKIMNFAGKVERMPANRLPKKLRGCFPTDPTWTDYKSGTASTLSYGKSLGRFWRKTSKYFSPEGGNWEDSGVFQMQPGTTTLTDEIWESWQDRHNTHIHNKMGDKQEWKRTVKEVFWEFGESRETD